jgi:hypothetical protein
MPNLSDTRMFNINARLPLNPVLGAPAWDAGSLAFTVDGDSNVDYAIRSSTNLIDWTTGSVTNPPRVPFRIAVPNPSAPRTFYRAEIQ